MKSSQFNESTMKKLKQPSQRHSIRLEIELPFVHDESFKIRKSSTFNDGLPVRNNESESFDNECSYGDELNEYNPTIKLHISFDTKSRAKKVQNDSSDSTAHMTSLQARKSFVTSDYSSSFCSSNDTKYSYENIYDKLDYNASMSNRRKSIATSSSLKNSFEQQNAKYAELPLVADKIRYRTYENERIHQSSCTSIFKREYTVNELFQNLESFNAQANELDNQTASSEVSSAKIDAKSTKSVSFLKQIRASLLRKTKWVKSSNKPIVANHKLDAHKQHTYVNERITRL